MNKKLLLIWTFLLCFVMGMSADKVIVFNEGTGTSDNSVKITTMKEIVKSGSENLTSITDAKNVYLARKGRGLKLGTSSKPGSMTLNLAAPAKPTAIKFKAMWYKNTEKTLKVAGTEFAELTGEVSEYSVTMDGNTTVNSITIATAGKRAYITELTIVEGTAASVATPTIEGTTPFIGTTTVTLACSTADAKIYYTLDGTNPTDASTEYTAPFSLDATAIVNAIAYKGKDASAVATMQFVAIPTVANIAELTQLADGTEFVFGGEAVVTAVPTAKHLYLKDATGVTFAYDVAGGFTFEPGQHIAAGWQGKVSFYKGLFEVVPTTALTAVEGVKDELTYDEVTPADVTLENANKVAVLKGVTYTAPAADSRNFEIKKDEAAVAGYNQFGLTIDEPVAGATYDILGVISRYNDNAQFQPVVITRNARWIQINKDVETGKDLAAVVAEETETVTAAGDKVGSVTLNLAANGAYTMSKAISSPASVQILGDATAPATIDASALTEPLVKIEGGSQPAFNQNGTVNAGYKGVDIVAVKNVKISSLSTSLLNDAQKSYIGEVVVENANVELVGSANVFDFKGYPASLSISNSTLWSKAGHTGQLIKTAGRVRDLDGEQAEYKQATSITNSTLYQVAVGKQFNNFQGKGQKSLVLTLKNSIIANSTQDGNEVRGWLGGQNSNNPTVVYENNTYINAGAEQAGWTDETKQGSDQTATSHNTDPGFADAANGDFTVAASSQQAKFRIGDSRWLVEYVPEDITAEKALLAEEIAKATALLGDADVENNEDAKALKAAIDEAQGVYDSAETKAEVNAAIEKLKAAEEAYAMSVARAELAAEIQNANALIEGKDTEADADANALKTAIDKAQGVYDNADATLEDVEKALEDLKAAEETYKLTLSISGVDAAAADDAAWYTLQGVRVAAPQKGIFIHNGKKVVLK